MAPLKFFGAFALGLVPAAGFALLSCLFLWRSYEGSSLDDIAHAQQTSGGTYASAIADDFYDYKLALYRERRPRIVAIGSSRTVQFRDLAFQDSFVSMGSAVQSLPQARQLLKDLKASGQMPAVALFGLDYWWFNAAYQAEDAAQPEPLLGILFSREKQAIERRLGRYFLPAGWLRTGKVRPREFLDIALRGMQHSPPLPPAYGLFAQSRAQGFAPDGHYRYLGTVLGMFPATDLKFEESRAFVRGGTSRYVFGAHPSEESFASLRELVAGFEAAGTKVITFVPPVASAFADEMHLQGDRLAYVPEVRARLRRELTTHYDFHDAAALGSTDCEFVDGFHGGEVTYLRIVLAIAQDPASGLAAYVDTEKLRTLIDHATGRVLADGEMYAPAYREVDFLDLGCKK